MCVSHLLHTFLFSWLRPAAWIFFIVFLQHWLHLCSSLKPLEETNWCLYFVHLRQSVCVVLKHFVALRIKLPGIKYKQNKFEYSELHLWCLPAHLGLILPLSFVAWITGFQRIWHNESFRLMPPFSVLMMLPSCQQGIWVGGDLVLGISMDRVLLVSFKCPSSPTEQAECSVILLQKPLIRKSAEQTKLLETAQWWLLAWWFKWA